MSQDSGYAPSEPVILDLEDKLKQSLVAILDGLDAEFDARFRNIESFKWMKLLDPAQFTSHSSSNEKTLIECVKTLKSANPFIQASDASIVKQFQTLYGDSELKSLMSDIKATGTLTEKLYELDIHEALPVVANIGDLAASTAMTSVACDKSFSVLRRIKSYQDPKIGQSNS